MVIRYLAVAVLLAGGLSACGDDDADDATPAAKITPPSSPAASAAPTPRGSRTDRAWELVSVDGKALIIRVDSRSCETEPQVNTAELDKYVQIETYAYVNGDDCAALPKAKWEKVDIGLKQALGSRDLVGCAPTDGSLDCRTGKLRTKPAATPDP